MTTRHQDLVGLPAMEVSTEVHLLPPSIPVKQDSNWRTR